MNRKTRAIAIAVLAALAVAATPAGAALILDGGWLADTVHAPGLESVQTQAGTYTGISFASPTLLTITDVPGGVDSFDLFDGASLLASSAPLAGVPFGDGLGQFPATYDGGLADPNYHGLQMVLAPGMYDLRLVGDIITGTGAGFGVRIDSDIIPEPGTLTLLALGGLALLRRRRRPRDAG